MLISYIGMYVSIVARGYLAYEMTGSAAILGVVSMATGIPMLLLSPIGGVIADRWDRRQILIASQLMMVVTSLLLAAMIHLHLIQIWHLVLFGLAQGAMFTINMPARSSVIPIIVGKELLANAIALTGSGRNLMGVIGPAIASVVIAVPWLGVAGVFDVAGLCYCASTLLMFRLPRNLEHRRNIPQIGVLKQLTEGFGYIRTRRPLLLLMSLGIVPVLLGMPYQSMLPVFQADVLRVDAGGLGMLFSAAGLGGVLGSLVVTYICNSPHQQIFQVLLGVLFGLTILLFASSTWFLLSVLLITLVGFSGNAYMALNSTLVMMSTDEAYYGRVMSIYMMIWSAMPLFSLPVGVLVDLWGAPLVLGAAASGIILFMVALLITTPRLRQQALPMSPTQVDSAPVHKEVV